MIDKWFKKDVKKVLIKNDYTLAIAYFDEDAKLL